MQDVTVNLGGRHVRRQDVVKVAVLVHPSDQDEDAPHGLYTIQGGPDEEDGTPAGERTVAYARVKDMLREVGSAARIASDIPAWTDNQLARLLQFRRVFVVLSTAEVYT